jgi:subfamily B ATP-binding cassette protein HlyB/CyaB
MNSLVNTIYERSLLKFVVIEHLADLLDATPERTFQKQENLSVAINTKTLVIILEGQVDIIDKSTQSRIEKLGPGKSIELDSLLDNKKRWNYDWIATTTTTVLLVSFEDFCNYLHPDYLNYLKIISQYIELQKFKNDMRLLGIPEINIRRLVLMMKKVSWDEVSSIPGSVFIVSNGSIEFQLKSGSQTYDLAKFAISEYFLAPDLPDVITKPSKDLTGWMLSYDDQVNSPEGSARFKILDIIGDKHTEILKEHESKTVREEDDFQDEMVEEEDKPLEYFYASEDEKKKENLIKPFAMLQNDMMDCGAACMSMICNFYGRSINIATWRSLLHVTREGASMLSIKRGSQRVGFDSIGVSVGFKGIHLLRKPFIALMAYHYVVVYKVFDETVLVADPEKGLISLTKDDFIKDFSKSVIALRPNDRLKAFPESKSAYRKYTFLVLEHRKELLEIIAYSMIILGLTLIQPIFLQFIFDNVLFEQNMMGLHIFAAIAIAANFILGCTVFARKSLSNKLTNKLNAKLSALLFRHILKLPLSYFALRNVGDITSRMDELDKIREYLSEKAIGTFINIMTLFIYASVLLLFHSSFFYLMIVSVVTIVLTVKNRFKEMKGVLHETFAVTAKNISISYEQVSSIKTIKSLSATLAARWRWEESLNRMLKQRLKFQKMVANLVSINAISQQVMTICFLLLSVYLYMNGQLSLGQIVAVNAIVASVIRPLISLIIDWDDFDKVKISLEKIDELVTSRIEGSTHEEAYEGSLQIKDIEFRDVWFRYGGDFSPWIIKGLNLKIKKGEVVAFIGSSGSGKSTLAYMLNLLYEPTKGEILINGRNLKSIPLGTLRSSISVILQEHASFTGSVISNIALGDTSPDFKKVIECSALADAHGFISALPSAYMTELGDGKQGLSGGQYQRINIARALYRNPEILILDEATSALDTLTEKVVVKNIKEVSKDKTTIIIAHRLNTIQHATRIVVLKNGKIIEEGDHQQLLSSQGAYYSMYKKQMH